MDKRNPLCLCGILFFLMAFLFRGCESFSPQNPQHHPICIKAMSHFVDSVLPTRLENQKICAAINEKPLTDQMHLFSSLCRNCMLLWGVTLFCPQRDNCFCSEIIHYCAFWNSAAPSRKQLYTACYKKHMFLLFFPFLSLSLALICILYIT